MWINNRIFGLVIFGITANGLINLINEITVLHILLSRKGMVEYSAGMMGDVRFDKILVGEMFTSCFAH